MTSVRTQAIVEDIRTPQNRRHDNIYATAALDARTVQWFLALGPSTQNVPALL